MWARGFFWEDVDEEEADGSTLGMVMWRVGGKGVVDAFGEGEEEEEEGREEERGG